MNAIFSDVPVWSWKDDSEEGWFTVMRRVNSSKEAPQTSSCLIDIRDSEFHLHCSPMLPAIDDDVNLTHIVAIVRDCRSIALCVDAKVAHDQTFKQKTEEIEVLKQSLGCRVQ